MANTAQIAKKDFSIFPIIGIGSSAGGLEALQGFFKACPDNMNMAFVLVSHLDPTHESLLTEILQRETEMLVTQATNNCLVEPNHVYVIPPNRDMEIFHGRLQLSVSEQPHSQRMPIDTFFTSLAEDQLDNASGIILSGTGSDGALGLNAINNAGGTTFVQEPKTAKFDAMPNNAIEQGHISFILPVNKIPTALIQHRSTSTKLVATVSNKHDVDDINQILMQLRKITGNDFSLYKKTTIGRRIERRMMQHEITDAKIYARYIKTHPEEAYILFKELLINVTQFFRDVQAFEILKEKILPQLLQNKPDGYVFRVWITGCSTGEETYSIAIILHELLEETQQNIKIQIFSSDLDDEAIDIARAGVYPESTCKFIPPERLDKFFTRIEMGFQINKNIREMIVFAVQNVVKDPPFTKLDFLSCRNLMIYLEPELQNRLMSTFHYALKDGGVLFLSPSESIGSHVELFTPLDRKWKFYTAKSSHTASGFTMSNLINASKTENTKTPTTEVIVPSNNIGIAELSRYVLIKYFAPASVITDMAGNIIYIHGETGKYLRPAPGQASLNIMDMARPGLEVELRAAIHEASNQGKSTLNREIPMLSNKESFTVCLSVRPIQAEITGRENILLISFTDFVSQPPKPKRKKPAKTAELQRIEELERDLNYLKESHKRSAEEQQASNEELQSTNEEIQSTNEELETSKEELQSVNEELITVNSELQNKIDALNSMQNDMKNLLDNTKIGIIFLDKELKIRSFTRDSTQIYRLVSSDVGRALNDIKPIPEETCDDLMEKAQTVLETLIPHEREFQMDNGVWIMARIQPYRTLDNFIDGVVLSFTDISARVQPIKDALSLAENMVNTVREPLVVMDEALNITAASLAFYNEFQVQPEETIGKHLFNLGNKQWDIPALRKMLNEVLSKGESFENYLVEHDFPSIGHRKMRLNARSMVGKTIKPMLILLSIEVDI